MRDRWVGEIGHDQIPAGILLGAVVPVIERYLDRALMVGIEINPVKEGKHLAVER